MIHAFRTLELNQIHLKGKRQWRVPGRKKNSDEQQKRSNNNKALRRTPIKIDKRWTVFLHNFYMWKVVVAIVDFFFVLFVFLSFTLLAVSRDGMRRWMRWALAINYYRFIDVWDICEMHTKCQLIMYCLYIFHEAKQHSNTHQKILCKKRPIRMTSMNKQWGERERVDKLNKRKVFFSFLSLSLTFWFSSIVWFIGTCQPIQ